MALVVDKLGSTLKVKDVGLASTGNWPSLEWRFESCKMSANLQGVALRD